VKETVGEMYAFARFIKAKPPLQLERTDTRLYFHPGLGRTQDDGSCLGSLWLQNPGSARYASSQTPLGQFAPVQPDPLMKHLRRVLDAVVDQSDIPDDAYVEILNAHYFCDAGGLKGADIIGLLPPQEICKHGIRASSQFLVLSLGKGWAEKFVRNVARAIAARNARLSVITPNATSQKDATTLRVRRQVWEPGQGVPVLGRSSYANPVGASGPWRAAYVNRVAAEIVASLP